MATEKQRTQLVLNSFSFFLFVFLLRTSFQLLQKSQAVIHLPSSDILGQRQVEVFKKLNNIALR